MAPAHERLHSQEAARAEIDDRLVLDEELLVGDRARDVGDQARLLLQHLLHRLLEGEEAVLARGLRKVHRRIGLAQQRLGACFLGRERHTNAG